MFVQNLKGNGFFQKKHYCQISPHGCQFDSTDLKLDKYVEKLFMMLHYKFDKVLRSTLDGTALLMWKLGYFDN